MSHGFLPRRDPALLGWSKNFLAQISESWASLGLTEQNVSDYTALHDAFAESMRSVVPQIRTMGAVCEKNSARAALKSNAKLLSNLINGQASVTNAQKADLGLNIRKSPTATPTPPSSPWLSVVSVSNQTVTARLWQHGEDTGVRGRPDHASGAVLFSYIGDEPPTNARDWTFEKLISKTRFQITFTETLPPGTKVWLSAAWFNHRKELGPAGAPVCTNLQGGGVSQPTSLRMAA